MASYIESLLAQLITSTVEDMLPPEFSKMKSNSERVVFMQKLVVEYGFNSPFNYIEDRKENIISETTRETGNKYYMDGKYTEALSFYNKSIMLAEKNSKELALAYANRSAVMYKKKYFEHCLQDIERALENNYPDELQSKLLERKKSATKLLPKKKVFSYYEPIPQFRSSDKNHSIPSASKAIKIVTGDVKGRKIVATRDIEVGEILMIEKAFAVSLSAEEVVLHCNSCLDLCFNMIPCDHCTTAMYCTEKCKYTAWNKYHKYECKIRKTLYEAKVEEFLLPLRMTIIARNCYHELDSLSVENYSVYLSDRYLEVHNLMTNEDKVDNFQLWILTERSVFIADLMEKHSSLFSEMQMPNIKTVFATLLMHNGLINRTNTMQLHKGKTGKKFEYLKAGRGLYPLMSLLNHSCNSNALCISCGNTMVVRAIHRINKNEEVCIPYGVSYYFTPRSERQARLKNLHFKCECQACTSYWPMFDRLPKINLLSAMQIDLMWKDITIDNVEKVKSILQILLQKARAFRNFYSYDWFVLEQRIRDCYAVLGNRDITL